MKESLHNTIFTFRVHEVIFFLGKIEMRNDLDHLCLKTFMLWQSFGLDNCNKIQVCMYLNIRILCKYIQIHSKYGFYGACMYTHTT